MAEPFDNPFELVYTSLWDMLETDERFEALKDGSDLLKVRERNLIKFDFPSNRDVLKEARSTVDYPQLILAMEGFDEINLINSSSSTKIVRRYSWVTSAGDFRINQIAPIEWAIITSAINWCTAGKLASLQWKEEEFVKNVDLIVGNLGQREEVQRSNSVIMGWVSILTVRVEMHFSTVNLRSLLT